MEYEHKGIKINFDEVRAQFSARIGGQMFRSASLASVKKKIDKAETFQPFDALRMPSWEDKKNNANYIPVRVIGIKKPAGKQTWRNSPEWVIESGRELRSLWKDTPENRKAIDDREALRKLHNELLEKMKKEKDEADAKIVRITTDNHSGNL